MRIELALNSLAIFKNKTLPQFHIEKKTMDDGTAGDGVSILFSIRNFNKK